MLAKLLKTTEEPLSRSLSTPLHAEKTAEQSVVLSPIDSHFLAVRNNRNHTLALSLNGNAVVLLHFPLLSLACLAFDQIT